MSPESFKSLFEWIGVGLLLLTFVAGYGVLHFGSQVDAQKDEHLRQFDKELTGAKKELGKQEERAANAEKALKDVANTAGAANERAGVANERAASLELETAKLKQQNLATEARLEEERNTRLALELSFMPRHVMLNPFAKQRLGRFAGTPYVLAFVPNDRESQRLAESINGALEMSGWKFQKFIPNEIGLRDATSSDGVVVEITQADSLPHSGAIYDAAADVTAYLQANRVKARMTGITNRVPAGTVLIAVDLLPTPYFAERMMENVNAPQEMRDIVEWATGLEKRQMEDLRKEWHFDK
jgi:hypothetical protein